MKPRRRKNQQREYERKEKSGGDAGRFPALPVLAAFFCTVSYISSLQSASSVSITSENKDDGNSIKKPGQPSMCRGRQANSVDLFDLNNFVLLYLFI